MFVIVWLIQLTKCCYMLVYIYPVDSKNYNEADFGILAEELLFWMSRGYTENVGGDFNARLGDLNILSKKICHWRYDEKVGKQSQIDFGFTNRNGRKFVSNFQIIDTKWHFSDHLSMLLSLS